VWRRLHGNHLHLRHPNERDTHRHREWPAGRASTPRGNWCGCRQEAAASFIRLIGLCNFLPKLAAVHSARHTCQNQSLAGFRDI